MIVLKGTHEYQKQIAEYIKYLRLDEEKHTQKSKALQCGMAFSTYVKLENSAQGSIEMLIKVLSTYGLLSKIDELTKIIEQSPSEKMTNCKNPKKKRVRQSKKGMQDD
jgi:hypothetical protein